jgi:hypothetical protein
MITMVVMWSSHRVTSGLPSQYNVVLLLPLTYKRPVPATTTYKYI